MPKFTLHRFIVSGVTLTQFNGVKQCKKTIKMDKKGAVFFIILSQWKQRISWCNLYLLEHILVKSVKRKTKILCL